MINVTHYPDTNSVEVTWLNDAGEQIRCHSYADVQMQMFRDDVAQYGGDISEHEALIAAVEANIKPFVEPVVTPLQKLQQLDTENALTQRNLRETVMLMAEAFKTVTNGAVDLSTIPGVAKVYAVEAEAVALRGQL